jgi:Zn-dependent protease with chaperone function
VGYVLHFLLAFGTLFLLPWVGDAWVQRSAEWVHWVPLLLLLPQALVLICRRFHRRGRRRSAAFFEGCLNFAPVYLQAIAFFGLGGMSLLLRLWPEAFGALDPQSISAWPDLGIVLALCPYFIFQALVIDARARLFGNPGWARRSRDFQLRMFLSMLLPFVLLALLSGAVQANATWEVYLQEVIFLEAIFVVLLGTVALLILPRLLTLIWNTQSMPAGETRAALEQLRQRAGLRLRDLMLWNTGGLMPNAMIVGLIPGTRRVLMTDALLDMSGPDEVEAVFGHELGHAKGHHGLLLGAYALGAVFAGDYLVSSLAPPLANSLGWDAEGITVVLLLLVMAVLARGFGSFSRLFEMEADLISMSITGNLGATANMLLKVTAPGAIDRKSWRHPSTRSRVDLLFSVAADPELGKRFHARLLWMKRATLLLFFSAITHQAWGAAQSWDRDWMLADLRLGEYQSAQARLAAGAEVGEELEALVGLAAELAPGQRDPGELLEAALLRLERGELEDALRLVELGFLRGGSELGDLLGALNRALEGGELEALPEPWRAALEANRRAHAQDSTTGDQ